MRRSTRRSCRRASVAEFPALPLWTDAYLGDTTHLTALEHGVYLLLLMIAWRTGDATLPDDDVLLARYAKLTNRQWARVKPVIAAFFAIENGRWTQRRLTDEFILVRRKREAQIANGQASALKRKGRHSTKREPSDSQASTPTPTPTPNAISNEIAPPPPPQGGDAEYAFFGKVIRLNSRDLAQWKRVYHAIPDIEAELLSIDAWLLSLPAEKQKDWFHRASGSLNRKHQEAIRNERDDGATEMPIC